MELFNICCEEFNFQIGFFVIATEKTTHKKYFIRNMVGNLPLQLIPKNWTGNKIYYNCFRLDEIKSKTVTKKYLDLFEWQHYPMGLFALFNDPYDFQQNQPEVVRFFEFDNIYEWIVIKAKEVDRINYDIKVIKTPDLLKQFEITDKKRPKKTNKFLDTRYTRPYLYLIFNELKELLKDKNWVGSNYISLQMQAYDQNKDLRFDKMHKLYNQLGEIYKPISFNADLVLKTFKFYGFLEFSLEVGINYIRLTEKGKQFDILKLPPDELLKVTELIF